MSIDTTCQSCGKRLRVGDEHAGKQARCPACQNVYTVPENPALSQIGASNDTGPDGWQMKTPDGLIYGPITKADLDRWCAEGRIIPQSQLLQVGSPQWQWAAEVYPQLSQAAIPSSTKSPAGPMPAGAVGPLVGAAGGPYVAPYYANYPKAHRGVLVLVLSVVGFLSFCAIPSLIAVILGLNDLREINAGKMDPQGRGLTLTGIVLGAIWVIGNIAYLGFVLLAMLGAFR